MARIRLKRLPAAAPAASQVAYPALLLAQNDHRFYFATIPIEDLFPCCFVARRDEDPAAGFQRALSEPRADDIAKYLASGTGSIPSNIVLSAQSNAQFKYDRRTKSISFARVPKAFLVLDGQHRLWGYQKCTTRHRVPAAIYEKLSRAEEAKLFVDINTTQRGVPAALLLDIKQVAQIENDREQTLRRLFDRLNRDSGSPMVGLLSPNKSIAGKISRVTFNKAVGPTLTSGVMMDANEEDKYKLLRNYLVAGEAIFDDGLILRSAFFEAYMAIFDEVVRAAISTKGSAKPNAIGAVLAPLSAVNYQGTGGRTLRNKGDILAAMTVTLRKTVTLSGEML
jgi:DGQHR domain-containing protein